MDTGPWVTCVFLAFLLGILSQCDGLRHEDTSEMCVKIRGSGAESIKKEYKKQ